MDERWRVRQGTELLAALPFGAAHILDGVFTVVNERFAAVVAGGVAELVGACAADLLAPEALDRAFAPPDSDGGARSWVPISGIGGDGAPWTAHALWSPTGPGDDGVLLVEPAEAPVHVPGRPEPVAPVERHMAVPGLDGVLSHDVRGGLRGANSFLLLLERALGDGLADPAPEYLATARASASRTDLMVSRLVHLLRSAHRPVSLAPVGLDGVAEAARARSERARDLEVQLDPGPLVWADPEALAEAVAEVLDNAATFAAGSGPVRMSWAPSVGPWSYLEVRDRGPGIAADLTEAAFRPFRLLQPKGRFPGVGMGLPICRALITAQGGACWFGTSDDPGTTMVIRLATAQAEVP